MDKYLLAGQGKILFASSSSSFLLTPLVLLADLLFFAGGEIVLDVESLADLLGGLALDHVGHSLACDIQQALYVQIVGSLRKNKVS